jgi:hypothetical protein
MDDTVKANVRKVRDLVQFWSWVLFSTLVLRIRNKSFRSSSGSGSGLQLASDPNSDPNLDSNPDHKLAKTFFHLKFLRSLIFKHKKAALPQLRDMARKKLRNKFEIYEDLTHVCILHVYSVRSAHKLRARRTVCKSFFFFSNEINCWRKVWAYLA